jgi:hypothetical protein
MRIAACSRLLFQIFFCQVIVFMALSTRSRALVEPVKLASAAYQDHGSSRRLTLWRQTLPFIGSRELVNYFMAHPREGSFPNTAFFLTSADAAGSSEEYVLWVRYIFDNSGVAPPDAWSAAFAMPVSGDIAYVVLAKSLIRDVTLEVHRVPLSSHLAPYPLNLDPTNYRSWPKSPDPISVISRSLVEKRISGIREIGVVVENRTLIVHGTRNRLTSPPVTIRFQLDTKEWSEVEFDDKNGASSTTPQPNPK